MRESRIVDVQTQGRNSGDEFATERCHSEPRRRLGSAKSSKLQHPSTREAPNNEAPRSSAAGLMFDAWCFSDLGAWNLELSPGRQLKSRAYQSTLRVTYITRPSTKKSAIVPMRRA